MIFTEIDLYAWASGAIAKFAGLSVKLKVLLKAKTGERIKKLRKLPAKYQPCDVMRNMDSFQLKRLF